MKTGDKGIALIKECEGLRLAAYRDGAGVWTIGYGHTRGVRQGMSCTEAEAGAWLREDLADAEASVDRWGLELTQDRFDALVSFVYNVGGGTFAKSTLLVKIRTGADAETVAYWFLRYHYSAGKPLLGLARRRAMEAALFTGLPKAKVADICRRRISDVDADRMESMM